MLLLTLMQLSASLTHRGCSSVVLALPAILVSSCATHFCHVFGLTKLQSFGGCWQPLKSAILIFEACVAAGAEFMVFVCVAVMRIHRSALMAPGSPSNVYQRLSLADTQPVFSLAFDMVAVVGDEM